MCWHGWLWVHGGAPHHTIATQQIYTDVSANGSNQTKMEGFFVISVFGVNNNNNNHVARTQLKMRVHSPEWVLGVGTHTRAGPACTLTTHLYTLLQPPAVINAIHAFTFTHTHTHTRAFAQNINFYSFRIWNLFFFSFCFSAFCNVSFCDLLSVDLHR